jgi:hypothetical protein
MIGRWLAFDSQSRADSLAAPSRDKFDSRFLESNTHSSQIIGPRFTLVVFEFRNSGQADSRTVG